MESNTNNQPAKEGQRCKYELAVEKYFGFNPNQTYEKLPVVTDFGQLVNLVAMAVQAEVLPTEGKDREIERLKGLIEDAYVQGRNDEKSKSETMGWEQFKSENNL